MDVTWAVVILNLNLTFIQTSHAAKIDSVLNSVLRKHLSLLTVSFFFLFSCYRHKFWRILFGLESQFDKVVIQLYWDVKKNNTFVNKTVLY